MPLEELPRIDEHSASAAAAPGTVWDAALTTLRAAFSPVPARVVARLLGCDPRSFDAAPGWDRGTPGAAIPGFRVVTARRPDLLVVAGRHRFSRYGIVVRVDPQGGGSVVRLESRATFPGPHGALYRLAVVGTGGHAVATARLARQIARRAERSTTAP